MTLGEQADEMESALFLPHCPPKSSDYSLLYAPSSVFMFIKFFYATYERVLQAQDLVREKINHDLAEMSAADKDAFNICEEKHISNDNQRRMHQLFFRERYEHLLKGIFATSTQ